MDNSSQQERDGQTGFPTAVDLKIYETTPTKNVCVLDSTLYSGYQEIVSLETVVKSDIVFSAELVVSVTVRRVDGWLGRLHQSDRLRFQPARSLACFELLTSPQTLVSVYLWQ